MRSNNHRLWLIALLLLLGTILLFLGGPGYYASRSVRHLWDAGHILYFALLTLVLIRWRVISAMPIVWQWITILVITLTAGIAIELLQYGTARSPNTGDILRDLTGSLLVLVFGPPASRLRPAHRRYVLQLAVTVITLVQLWPLTRSLVDEAVAWYQFPLLSGFETPFEIDRWEGGSRLSVKSVSPFTSNRLLKVSLTTDEYSGAALKYFDGDWSSAHTLKISFYNPDTRPLQITCRLHDHLHSDGNGQYEDRYNRRFTLKPGWNLIAIDLEEVKHSPSNRAMDMSRIRGVMCFAVSLPEARIVYLDDVRLVD